MDKDCIEEKYKGYKTDSVSPGSNIASREMTFREVLEIKIKGLHDEINTLEQLSQSLPITLPHQADRAMRKFLNK